MEWEDGSGRLSVVSNLPPPDAGGSSIDVTGTSVLGMAQLWAANDAFDDFMPKLGYSISYLTVQSVHVLWGIHLQTPPAILPGMFAFSWMQHRNR